MSEKKTLMILQMKATIAKTNFTIARDAIIALPPPCKEDRRYPALRKKYDEAEIAWKKATMAFKDAYAKTQGYCNYLDQVLTKPLD